LLEGVDLPPRGSGPLGHQNIKDLHTREELLQALAALDAGAFDDQEMDEDDEEQPEPRNSKPKPKQKRIETEEQKNIRLAPRRAREQAKREQAQRDQDKELTAAAAPKTRKKGANLGKAQQELGAQQRQAKAKVSGGVPKDAQEPFILDTAKVSSFPASFRTRAPHSFAPNSCAKDRAPNNFLLKALPGAGCQTDYRQKLPDILVAPALAHTYGL
jgi:hypothetical protein